MVKFRRLKKKDIEHNLLHRWLTFFDKNTSDKTIQKIIEMDTSIEKAHKKIMSVAQDRDMLRLYEMHEKAMYDYTSGINNATRKGEQRGMQKGIAIGEQRGITIGEQRGVQKAQRDYVLKSFQKGLPVGDIAELTGLSVDEVNHILNSH
jgi:predicted transposase/invertase (TIGR01784 family)